MNQFERSTHLVALRQSIRSQYLADEKETLQRLLATSRLTDAERSDISGRAAQLVREIRNNAKQTILEKFLAQYSLSTEEGVALMCLAEALLRVPDAQTKNELIKDKVTAGDWAANQGQADSSLINLATIALRATSFVVQGEDSETLLRHLRKAIQSVGEPLIRQAVSQAMKEMGHIFVLGRDIEEALQRGRNYEVKGYTYSYDMLGEAARTDADALRYMASYSAAIDKLSAQCHSDDIRKNPGISVKLSALHPRYEFAQAERVRTELVSRVLDLAQKAKRANMGFNIDAEEADRLDLSLDVIEQVLSDDSLIGWDGFGIVVQAFGQRATYVLDWLYQLSISLDRKIMVRLVKGAYWDMEIKRAQELGLSGFPVFTKKVNSDVSYLVCAEKLFAMTDRIYPQFASHNAHTVAAVAHIAQKTKTDIHAFEFQRLHGMGESLAEAVRSEYGTKCRIYAPVGAHSDLLAYLVRRLLENGANSSFVNQISDNSIQPEAIVRDPIATVLANTENASADYIRKPKALFGDRLNSMGWDLSDSTTFEALETKRQSFAKTQWQVGPMMAVDSISAISQPVLNPANPNEVVGTVIQTEISDVQPAINAAQQGVTDWNLKAAAERATILRKVADKFEEHHAEIFALLAREAGKSMPDAIAELREAVDFARYYADESLAHAEFGEKRGVFACISPWNFPLAIFSGQVLAALAAGNAVVAKPAEQSSLIAGLAVKLMHEAGIPVSALQLLPGSGATVGTEITSNPGIAGICFTGSTQTAQRINRVMSEFLKPDAPLIAETGGLNAMIVDSSALPEQVVRDVLASAFQSAGQRCSALRMLYLQEDIADDVLEMLFGAMEELRIGNPWYLSTDVGPVIDETARQKILNHCVEHKAAGRLLKQLRVPAEGHFVAPTVIKVDGIEALEEEIFGPVLHVATFRADEIDDVVDNINAKGFGLTFGLHTRVNARIDQILKRIKVGNVYVNRNQIGAIVGSQPFGGEGLSGTGPKAGGPSYVKRFKTGGSNSSLNPHTQNVVEAETVQNRILQLNEAGNDIGEVLSSEQQQYLLGELGQRASSLVQGSIEMPGPTGELNQLRHFARGVLLCLGPDLHSAYQQACYALLQGNGVIVFVDFVDAKFEALKARGYQIEVIVGQLDAEALDGLEGFAGVLVNADHQDLRNMRKTLAHREGAILPLITDYHLPERLVIERHYCIDMTAAGGNIQLVTTAQ